MLEVDRRRVDQMRNQTKQEMARDFFGGQEKEKEKKTKKKEKEEKVKEEK